jgi:phosphotriesterase-related protein
MGLPNWEPTHLFKRVVPQLKARGVTEEQLRTIFVDNPRRYFQGTESPR